MAKKSKEQKETDATETPPVAAEAANKPRITPGMRALGMPIALAIAIPALAIAGLALYEQRNSAQTIADMQTRMRDAGTVTAGHLTQAENRIMDEIARIRNEMENLPAPVAFDAKPIETRLAAIESRLTELAELATAATEPPLTAPSNEAITESSWSWRRIFGDAFKITTVDTEEGN